jgi:hypothetical protein
VESNASLQFLQRYVHSLSASFTVVYLTELFDWKASSGASLLDASSTLLSVLTWILTSALNVEYLCVFVKCDSPSYTSLFLSAAYSFLSSHRSKPFLVINLHSLFVSENADKISPLIDRPPALWGKKALSYFSESGWVFETFAPTYQMPLSLNLAELDTKTFFEV